MSDQPPTKIPVDPRSTPTPPGPPTPVKQTERPHPLTPFVRGWIVLVAIVFGFGRTIIEQLTGRDGNGFARSDLGLLLPVIGGLVLLSALGGFVSWFFTRFVIDDDELRIETGALFKNSKRVSFERLQSVDVIQPLAARIFGLAELRLEVGAGDSAVRLRYLGRSNATRLRDFLVARAHGDRSVSATAASPHQTSALTDLSRAERPIVTISPQQLVGGFLLSSDWLVSALFVVAGFVLTAVFGVTLYALPGLLPLAFGAITLVSRRVIAQFNYTLAQSPRGLRISRGLTNLTSQSVPVDRIQGVRVSQSILWRRFGWYRIDIDVLGFGRGNDDSQSSDVSSILLPVATSAQTAAALAQVLPGVDLDAVELTASPRRSRRFRPFDFWTLKYGFDDAVVVATHGWLTHVREVVPHAKTQSVRIEQGPLQRRARLADVHVHTPRGPVNLVAKHLDPAAARALALTQLDRAREARADGRLVADAQTSDAAVLDRFGLLGVQPLGAGGEATVYPLDEARVLRVYQPGHDSRSDVPHQLKALYDGWETGVGPARPPFELPLVLQIGTVAGRTYTLDRRMSGRSLSEWLPTAEVDQRRAGLVSYLELAQQLQRLPLPTPRFARLLGDAPRTFDTFFELMDDQLRTGWTRVEAGLVRDVPDAFGVLDRLRWELSQRQCTPTLVHGDFFPGNVFASRTADGRVVATGVGDFSPHTLAGDPLLDVAGAVELLALEPYGDAVADSEWLRSVAVQRLGGDSAHWIDVYRRFYAIYFAADPLVYPYSVAQLKAPTR